MPKLQKPGAASTNRAAKNAVAFEDTVPEIVNSSCESEDVIVVEERPIKEIIQ